MSSMRRESKPLRYMLMVCRTKEAMPRSICPALALPCAPVLLASCKVAEAEIPACKPALLSAAWRAHRRFSASGVLPQSQHGGQVKSQLLEMSPTTYAP